MTTLDVSPNRAPSLQPASPELERRDYLKSRTAAVCLAVGIGAYLVSAAPLWNWVVDDAGITFAYARNLAEGHGLVAQPGQVPVEGFSNPLWTFFVSVLYGLGLFDPALTPKIIGHALVALSLTFVWLDLRPRFRTVTEGLLPLALIGACSSFVIWTTSGLENALLVALLTGLAWFSLRCVVSTRESSVSCVAAGCVAAAAALTRPDAIVYAPMFVVALGMSTWAHEPTPFSHWIKRAVSYSLGFLPTYGGYLLFRVSYFGELVPNTYFAKPKPEVANLSAGKLMDLFSSACGDLAVPVLLVGIAAAVYALRRGVLTRRSALLGLFLAAAASVHLVMPVDWMGENRFATPFYPFLFWTLAELWLNLRGELPTVAARLVGIASVVFLAQALVVFTARTLFFAALPTVPLSEVRASAGAAYNRLIDALDTPSTTLLTPDLGGALLDSKARVYDVAGLCDETIAKALGRNDPQAIRDYVLDTVRPTFIHLHGAFIRASSLPLDSRFVRDYATIHERADPPAGWARMWEGGPVPAWSGDYVRRDALASRGGSVDAIRAAYVAAGLADVRPWVRPTRRGSPFDLLWAIDFYQGPALLPENAR